MMLAVSNGTELSRLVNGKESDVMALFKSVRQDDGVTTNYHRIISLNLWPNSHISIGVLSYVDEKSRRDNNILGTPYNRSTTYEIDYDENMSITGAYEYLKTLPEFEDAEDV